ncbi:MAG: Gfo/Idh/MocA family oxidoreductase [Planctomycetes bacterium]|nr:Gfo/Idh/MocA family oxidoreductase [Planctomycetota bacterium]
MKTRRQFLEDSILATAAAATAAVGVPAAARGKPRTSANETIRAAILGCGIRGKQHVDELSRVSGCEIAYVCDPDVERVEKLIRQTQPQQGRAPKGVRDMRAIFDDPAVDAVFIATCNHWHALAAIWAMLAGKDVYLEKPVSHNVWEGRRIVQVARKTSRLCQTGTQRRSERPLAAAIEYMRQGKLGEVKLARSIIYGRRESIGGPGRYEVPAAVDYKLWAGPAPMSPITRPSFHYDWHWFWETGNGELGNNNIHTVDVCRWGLGVTGLGRHVLSYGGRFGYQDAGQTPNTQVVIHDFGDKTIVQETRGLKTPPFSEKFKDGYIFYGSEGMLAGTSLFDLDGKLVRTFTGEGESHFANFLRAVRSRKQEDLHADILEGHQSSALCHVGNISYRLGRPVSVAEIRSALEEVKPHDAVLETFERTRNHLADNGIDLEKTPLTLGPLLRLDDEREAFAGNEAANHLLAREYRKPFVVPAEGEV